MTAHPALLTAAAIRKMLPRRSESSHKGQNGHVLIIAGSRGMSGAAVLSARAALRSGAGLVTVAIVKSERTAITRQLPEAMTLALPQSPKGTLRSSALPILRRYIERRKINVLAIGPGLTVTPAVASIVKSFIKNWEKPMVLDADGLNNIALADLKNRRQVVITPHVGELAHLLKVKTNVIQKNRAAVAQKVARQTQGVCVLKGHSTVIADAKQLRLNPTGNSAMATGGMGDVLTGAIAGFMAQGLTLWQAASAGVYLHGLAGDLARTSDRGLLATDVADALPKALAKIGVR